MIARLSGKLSDKSPGRVIVDVNGVGYEIFISLPTYGALAAPGSDVVLDIYTHVREDIIQLYGFSSRPEKTIFERLTGISGIGPRLALTILSGSSVEDLIASIKREDLARLTKIPGVGKKTAERIILELKDKLRGFVVDDERTDSDHDVVSAMENLGYNRGQIEVALKRARTGEQDPGFDQLFKRTLQILTKG